MFRRARVVLTCWYVLAAMIVSIGFSVTISTILLPKIDKIVFIWQPPNINTSRPIINTDSNLTPIKAPFNQKVAVRRATAQQLVITNTIILVVSVVIGYMLAGRTLKPLRQSHERQKQFSSNAAHELGTPIATIITDSEVHLADPAISLPKAKQVIASNLQEAQNMRSLTSTLLSLEYFADKPSAVNITKQPLSANLNQVIKRVAPELRRRRLTINTNGTNGHKLLINQDHLQLLLSILIDNAIKYSLSAGQIDIQAHASGKQLTIKISNPSQRLTKVDLNHVFDRFYRAPNTIRMRGYGLGLSLAKSLVETYSGKIGLTHEDGVTTVIVTFPKA